MTLRCTASIPVVFDDVSSILRDDTMVDMMKNLCERGTSTLRWGTNTSKLAARIRDLCLGSHPLPTIDIEKALAWVEVKVELQLAPAQRNAIALATTSKMLIITGGPGVGKTTIVDSILRILSAKKLVCLL